MTRCVRSFATPWILAVLALSWTVSAPARADSCATPIRFYYISSDTVAAEYGMNVDPHNAAVAKLESAARATIVRLNQMTNYGLDFCFEAFHAIKPIELAKYPFLAPEIAELSSFSAKVAPYTNPQPVAGELPLVVNVKQPERSEQLRSELRKRSTKFCATVQLNIAALAAELAKQPGGIGPTAELPIRAFVVDCYPLDNLTVREGGASVLSGLTGGQFSLPDFGYALLQEGATYTARAISSFERVPSRRNEPPALRSKQLAVHVRTMRPGDITFIHEIGHYLGLSHLGSSLLQGDLDQKESGVRDTPSSVETLDDDIDGKQIYDWLKLARDKWPKATASATDTVTGAKIEEKPLDNIMNWGGEEKIAFQFSRDQIRVMKRMRDFMQFGAQRSHKMLDLRNKTDADGIVREISFCSRPSPGSTALPGHMFVAYSTVTKTGDRRYLAVGYSTNATPGNAVLSYFKSFSPVGGVMHEEDYTDVNEQCLVLKVNKEKYEQALVYARPAVETAFPNGQLPPITPLYRLGEEDCVAFAVNAASVFTSMGVAIPPRETFELPMTYMRRIIDAN